MFFVIIIIKITIIIIIIIIKTIIINGNFINDLFPNWVQPFLSQSYPIYLSFAGFFIWISVVIIQISEQCAPGLLSHYAEEEEEIKLQAR